MLDIGGILDFIEERQKTTGEWPTIADVAAHYGVQRARARRWLGVLEQEGLVAVRIRRDRSAGYVERLDSVRGS